LPPLLAQITQSSSSQVIYFPNSLDEGTLYSWGNDLDNKYGVLGLGNTFKALRPFPNSSLFDYMIKNVSISETHASAVDSTGRLFCWGFGPNGELGLENQTQVLVPTIV
jgi:alpha-tubulin suppressor-like RCC1 family protein